MTDTVCFSPSLLDSHCVVDVRTPREFSEDHIPGAVNIPLLTDEERVVIGTLYKQQGAHTARIRALELTCGRFADIVKRCAETAGERPMLVCCWRGGLRSRSVTTLLRMVGYKAFQLQGGYKSYRNHVISYFEHFVPPAMLVVIHGMTGVGKTTFINRLDKNCFSTIDLEAVAQHRGSAFGSVGQQQHHTQKRFETLLWDLFRNVPNGRPLILEGESQRIGKLLLPGTMYTVMANSMKIWCHASLETRVERLIAEYGTDDYRQQIGEALDRIRKKLGGACHAELSNLLKTGDLQRVARGLIQEYYDKIYYKHRSWISDIELELEDFATAEKQLKMYLSRIIPESAHSPSSSSMANAKFFARPDGAITP